MLQTFSSAGAAEFQLGVGRDYRMGLGLHRLSINGVGVTYETRSDGRLASITRDGTGEVFAKYAYLGSGPAASIAYGNKTTETRTFDSRGRMTGQSFGPDLALVYGYGSDGLTRRVTTKHGDTSESLLLALDSGGRVQEELQGVRAISAHSSREASTTPRFWHLRARLKVLAPMPSTRRTIGRMSRGTASCTHRTLILPTRTSRHQRVMRPMTWMVGNLPLGVERSRTTSGGAFRELEGLGSTVRTCTMGSGAGLESCSGHDVDLPTTAMT